MAAGFLLLAFVTGTGITLRRPREVSRQPLVMTDGNLAARPS